MPTLTHSLPTQRTNYCVGNMISNAIEKPTAHWLSQTLASVAAIERRLTAAASSGQPLRQQAVVSQHGLQQDLRASRALLWRGVLGLIVTDTTAAGHEDHRAWRNPRDVARIMSGARDNLTCRETG